MSPTSPAHDGSPSVRPLATGAERASVGRGVATYRTPAHRGGAIKGARPVARARGRDTGVRGTAAQLPARAARSAPRDHVRQLCADQLGDCRLPPLDAVGRHPGFGRPPPRSRRRRPRRRASPQRTAARARVGARANQTDDPGVAASVAYPIQLDRGRAGRRPGAGNSGVRARPRSPAPRDQEWSSSALCPGWSLPSAGGRARPQCYRRRPGDRPAT